MQTETAVFTRAQAAFRQIRGLAFTIEWHRFPWTRGPHRELALIGPAYLGNVAIGLHDNSWIYPCRTGHELRYVHRDRLDILVEDVVNEHAGVVPVLPRRKG